MDANKLIEKLQEELTQRGIRFRYSDVFAFVVSNYGEYRAARLPVETWADTYEEALMR